MGVLVAAKLINNAAGGDQLRAIRFILRYYGSVGYSFLRLSVLISIVDGTGIVQNAKARQLSESRISVAGVISTWTV